MREHVTVVPADKVILVDGVALRFDFPAPANLRAVQWHNGQGHMEFTDACNHTLSGRELYDEEVAPFVALWEAEKARRVTEAAAEAARQEAEYNSPEARAERIRAVRNARIAASDRFMLADAPVSDSQRAAWTAYRRALRDLPGQAGFPWDGGGETTPWPTGPNTPAPPAPPQSEDAPAATTTDNNPQSEV